jgi:hypothetical protein
MSKGVKKVLGVVAAIAVPFIAAPLASAIGISGAVGQAAVGAGLGAAASAATGGNPVVGALTGGATTFARAGGLDNLFGGPQPLVAGQESVGGGLLSGSPGMTTGTPLYQQAGYTAGGAQSLLPTAATAAPAVTTGINTLGTVAQAAAPAAATGYLESGTLTGGGGADALSGGGGADTLSSGLRSGISALTDPATLARVTLLATMGDTGDMEGVSAAEQELVELRKQELQQIASTNQELFDLQVKAANDFMQMAAQRAANPEAAFAETKIKAERKFNEDVRGLGADEARALKRQADIRGTQVGATAAAANVAYKGDEQAKLLQTGAGMLPTAAPEGYAGLSLPLYEDLAERRRQAQYDAFKYAGALAPGLFSRTIG